MEFKFNKKSKNLEVKITYKQFIEFTKIKKCHYCEEKLNWKPYGGTKYYLDRKNNNEGYSIKNCVVCCTKCNYGKGNRYSYKEWFEMTSYFRNNK